MLARKHQIMQRKHDQPLSYVPHSISWRSLFAAYSMPIGKTARPMVVGVIELDGGYTSKGLYNFARNWGCTAIIKQIIVYGANVQLDSADDEVYGDIEVLLAGCNPLIKVAFAPNTDQGFAAGIDALVDNGVDAISCSWGAPESSWDADGIKLMEAALKNASDKKIPVFCASGDNGADDGANDGKPHVDYPSSSPNAIAVGGTSLILGANGLRASESLWNNTTGASGGGKSSLFEGRTVPLVCAHADPMSGYLLYSDDCWQTVGGTSMATPLITAQYLRLKSEIGGLSFDFPSAVMAAGNCFDVVAGDNTFNGVPGFSAGAGPDIPSGYGVPDYAKMLAWLQKNVVAQTSLVAWTDSEEARKYQSAFPPTAPSFEALAPKQNLFARLRRAWRAFTARY